MSVASSTLDSIIPFSPIYSTVICLCMYWIIIDMTLPIFSKSVLKMLIQVSRDSLVDLLAFMFFLIAIPMIVIFILTSKSSFKVSFIFPIMSKTWFCTGATFLVCKIGKYDIIGCSNGSSLLHSVSIIAINAFDFVTLAAVFNSLMMSLSGIPYMCLCHKTSFNQNIKPSTSENFMGTRLEMSY
ncbi:predicted protein [Lodderomyces elongisporus NRRL YB-4239]|uniref:Uncharacterized protein n=1 Tax=Lodderomyces elongisporus (strain ATCC 11503 / CBS 2605 / JCM 1781 / NBRC 1676 / NRRL YB-4239) TaxID=379508 RepID=A5H2P3_LODEL|nr:predicted protein [Lodderomyces elongisporus NRRL YB-4239]